MSIGGRAQHRYERLRAYVLAEPSPRPRVSPEQFDGRRLERFGLLGLVDGEPVRSDSDFEIELVPLGAADAEQRLAGLLALLAELVTGGGGNATSGVVRPGVDRPAGAGAEAAEPACGDYAIR